MGKLLLSQQPWLNIPLLKYDVGGEAVLQLVAQLSNVLTRWHQWPASSPAAGLFLRTGLKCIQLHKAESWGTHKFKLCEHYSGMGDVGFEQHGLQTWLVLNIANYFTTFGSHKLTEEKYDTFSLSLNSQNTEEDQDCMKDNWKHHWFCCSFLKKF